jgi:hypothetical protein
MYSREFEDLWREIQRRGRAKPEVRNWTVLKGYLGDTMKIVGVHAETIEVDAPRAKNLVTVPKAHFQAVWQMWPRYKNRQVQRQELTEMTFFSKYIISILHWVEEE